MLEQLKLFSLLRRDQFFGLSGRFPGLGFYLLAAPSHPSIGSGQWLNVRLSSPSQWRDRTGVAPVSLLSFRAPEARGGSYSCGLRGCQVFYLHRFLAEPH
jgi:hypothetical protein